MENASSVQRDFRVFHHDYNCQLEKSGKIQLHNTVVCKKTGIIKTQITLLDITKFQTMFPPSWSREHVWNKIVESFDNVIEQPVLQQDGKFHAIGLTSEGIEIETVFNTDQEILTSYPLFED